MFGIPNRESHYQTGREGWKVWYSTIDMIIRWSELSGSSHKWTPSGCEKGKVSITRACHLTWRALPHKSLMGMCRWMGSYFHDWIDYHGVAFSIELLGWGHTFSDFWGKMLFI